MRAIFKPVFKRGNSKKDKIEVKILCLVNRRKRTLPTGIFISDHQWDEQRNMIINHHLATEYNNVIDMKINELEKIELDMLTMGKRLNIEHIQENFQTALRGCFIQYCYNQHREDMSVAVSTYQYRKRAIDILAKMWKKQTLSFLDVDYRLIERYNNHMVKMGLHPATIRKNHSVIRLYVQSAMMKNLITKNPYDTYKLKPLPKKMHNILTREQLDQLTKMQLPDDDPRELTRLRFLFSCFTGLRLSDTEALTKHHIKKNKIAMHQQKTGQPVVVPLNLFQGQAQDILNRLRTLTEGTGKHIFPKTNRVTMDYHLKAIGAQMDLGFKLHFHISRHTFCTMVAIETGSMFKVMEYAGIQAVSTAMVYVNLAQVYSD